MAEHNGGNRSGKDRGSFGGGPAFGWRPVPRHQIIRAAIPADSAPGTTAVRPSRGGADRDRKPLGTVRAVRVSVSRKPFGIVTVSRLVSVRPVRVVVSVAALVAVIAIVSRLVIVPCREGGGERRSFGAGDRDRKPFGDRPRREGGGERRSFGGGRDRKPFGDRPRREGGGERRSFGGGDRKPFGERPRVRVAVSVAALVAVTVIVSRLVSVRPVRVAAT